MKKFNLVLTVFFVVLLLTQCAREYIPTTMNSPLLTNKGEIQIGLLGGTSGFDQQFSAAITDNIGVIATSSFSSQNSDTSSTDYHRHFLADGGVGYYKSFSNIGRFEVFVGYGFGSISTRIEESLYTSIADLTYHKIFLQPGFGATTSFFDISMSPRFSFVLIENKSPRLFIEPVFVSKVGYKYLFLTMQLGFAVPVFAPDDSIIMQPFIGSLGVQFKFGKIYDNDSSL